MFRRLLVLSALFSSGCSASVLKLTDDDYKEKTEGKTVFLKMFAPWVSSLVGSSRLLAVPGSGRPFCAEVCHYAFLIACREVKPIALTVHLLLLQLQW
jgi:hypothetical protein